MVYLTKDISVRVRIKTDQKAQVKVISVEILLCIYLQTFELLPFGKNVKNPFIVPSIKLPDKYQT